MKIPLKISIETLAAIHEVIQGIYTQQPTQELTQKLYRSIGFEVVEKFDSKRKAIIKKSNGAFNPADEITISLKFHEAWALKYLLTALSESITNGWAINENRKIINFLDQKTA